MPVSEAAASSLLDPTGSISQSTAWSRREALAAAPNSLRAPPDSRRDRPAEGGKPPSLGTVFRGRMPRRAVDHDACPDLNVFTAATQDELQALAAATHVTPGRGQQH